MSYISKEAAVKLLEDHDGNFLDTEGKWWSIGLNAAISHIKQLPAVDVVPVVHGRWEPGDRICPVCKQDKFKDLDADIWADWTPPYCPNCGAKMYR